MNNFNLLITKVKSKSLKSILNLSILYITSILGFAKFLIVAYLELPEIYGKYILLISILIFTGCFISFGEIELTIKKYPTYWVKKQYKLINESISRLILLMFFRTSLVLLIYILYAYLFEEKNNLIVLGASFFIVFNQSISPLFTSIFRSSDSLSFFAYTQLIRTLVTLLFVATAAYYFSWKGLLIAEAISSIIIFPILLFFINRQFSEEKTKFVIYFKVGRDLLKNVFRVSNISGLYLYLSIMLVSIPLYLDKLIITEFLNLESVGLYGICFLIVQIGVLVNNILSQKAGPDFIKNKVNNNNFSLNKELLKWVLVGVFMQIIISIFSVIVIKFGLLSYYLPEYNINIDIYLYACLLSLFQFTGLTEFALISIDREKMIFTSNIFYCVLFLTSFAAVGYLNLGLASFFCAFIFSKIGQVSLQLYFINQVKKLN